MTKTVQSNSEPLLIIVIDGEGSAPKVKYKDKGITITHEPGKLEYAVQHREGMEYRTIQQRGE